MKLISVSPVDNSTEIALSTTIVLTFDNIIKESLINSSIFVRKLVTTQPYANVGPITPMTTAKILSYTYSIDNTNSYSILTLTLSELLENGLEYKIIVMSTLTSDDGLDLIDRAYASSFTASSIGVSAPPDQTSLVIGQIPDIEEFYSGTTAQLTEGLSVINTSPLNQTFGYDTIDEIEITFSEAILDTGYTILIQDISLDTLNIIEITDATVVVLADKMTITLADPIALANKKIAITLSNIVAAADSSRRIDSYHYEIVTNFDPFYADIWFAILELANATGNSRYYIAHMIYYASREAEILSGRCEDDPIMMYYRQKWTMAKAIYDLSAHASATSTNAFVTSVTLAHITVQRELNESTGGNGMKIAYDEMRRYELPLLTCGTAIPDGVLPPESALIYANTDWVKMAGRSPGQNVSNIVQNAVSGGNGNIYTRTYQDGGGLFR